MNHLLPTPTGIKYYIQALQVLLYDRLVASWGVSGLTSSQYQFYGLAQKNYRKDGYIPEVFISGKEYKEVLFDDKLAALMWFGLNDSEAVDETGQHRYNISLYGFVNLNSIKPDDSNRADIDVIDDVVNLINGSFGFYVKNVYHNADRILSEYSGVRIKEGILLFNMQPNAIFRIDMSIMQRIEPGLFKCVPQYVSPRYANTVTGDIQLRFKDSPDTSIMQTLVNGARIPLEYQAGLTTVTIPHLIGRYVFSGIVLNGSNYTTVENDTNWMPYDMTIGEFTYDQGYRDGDIMTIQCNEA